MLTPTAVDLIHEMEQMYIIDCHEHLSSEEDRLKQPVDVFTLFAHYTRTDLVTAGMPADVYDSKLRDPEIPLDERWAMFKPFLQEIRFGSYARPAFVAAKEFFGCDDINDDTYRVISERIAQHNTPGLYHRVLRERCRIQTCMNQTVTQPREDGLLANVPWLSGLNAIGTHQELSAVCRQYKKRPRSLEGYVGLIRSAMTKWKEEDNALAFKLPFCHRRPDPSAKDAAKSFKKLLDKKKLSLAEHDALESYLVDECMKIVRDLDSVMAVHTGMWGDFPGLDAKLFIPWIIRHPETKIDLYHLSMPSVRDCIVIGKNFPNVWLNLCWTHIISQKMTVSAMDEMLDIVPVNKVLGFGGDYALPVEKVLGHLMMAREDIAVVLGRRMDAGLMNRDEALGIIRKWLWDNPKELYRLDV